MTSAHLSRPEPKGNRMLVLSRKRDERIMIGDDVVITIVDIRGDKVRLGIEAPNDIPIHRQEVYDAIAREKKVETVADSPKVKEEKPGKKSETKKTAKTKK